MEVGLIDEATIKRERSPAPTLIPDPTPRRLRPARLVRFRSQAEIFEEKVGKDVDSEWDSTSDGEDADHETLASARLHPDQHMIAYSKMYRLGLLAVILALLLPLLQLNPISVIGVKGGASPQRPANYVEGTKIVKREDTNTVICKRWSHQCKFDIANLLIWEMLISSATVVNGTLYIYGGQSTTDAKQASDTWGKLSSQPTPPTH